MLTGSVSSEHFGFKSAEVSVVRCNLYFYIDNIKEDSFPYLVCKDKVDFKSLCLNAQVVENLWFLLRAAL